MLSEEIIVYAYQRIQSMQTNFSSELGLYCMHKLLGMNPNLLKVKSKLKKFNSLYSTQSSRLLNNPNSCIRTKFDPNGLSTILLLSRCGWIIILNDTHETDTHPHTHKQHTALHLDETHGNLRHSADYLHRQLIKTVIISGF